MIKSVHLFQVDFKMIRCAVDEFQCSDYSCIPIENFCDARSDCSDGSDEHDDCVKNVRFHWNFYSLSNSSSNISVVRKWKLFFIEIRHAKF